MRSSCASAPVSENPREHGAAKSMGWEEHGAAIITRTCGLPPLLGGSCPRKGLSWRPTFSVIAHDFPRGHRHRPWPGYGPAVNQRRRCMRQSHKSRRMDTSKIPRNKKKKAVDETDTDNPAEHQPMPATCYKMQRLMPVTHAAYTLPTCMVCIEINGPGTRVQNHRRIVVGNSCEWAPAC